jgi:hypothetical protein
VKAVADSTLAGEVSMACYAEDFRRPWQKPAYGEILACLEKLRVDPPVWNLKISRAEILREQDTTLQHRREIASYLSSIISSNLAWLDDDDQREEIWTVASKRLSERCGRAGRSILLSKPRPRH